MVFLQKVESVRRYQAFCMLLQRYLIFGSFPHGYRGWYDAFENYTHRARHGSSAKYDVKPFRESNFSRRIPPDAFVWFGVTFLSGIPFISIILMWVMAIGMGVKIGPYTGLVVATTLIGAIFYVWFWGQIKQLTRGEKTFRYFAVIFGKLLKHAPPFDPYMNDSLN